MFEFLKKRIPADLLGTALLPFASLSEEEQQRLQTSLPEGIDRNSAFWDIFCLRVFAADFAVWSTLGDTSTKNAILDQFYAEVRQPISDEAFDHLQTRLIVYTDAVKTPHPNGIPYTVGKTFGSLLTGADLPSVFLTMEGSIQFTATFRAVTKTIKSFRIVP